MDFEKLALEVSAKKAGMTPVNPRALQGDSGVAHRFSLLFTDGTYRFAFDLYDRVTEVEVVKSYIKKFDTGLPVDIVCTGGEVTDKARDLALEYEMKILTPEAAGKFLSLERAAPRRPSA